ncbi:MAG: Beta-phosphoglucomutase [uncultured Thermomicrobiales bacterium]|uniref:Beta-phosphoglucomutase n=1 Tax=uncultured Thermomicrobiales bacterium TaxID=1645740 RepID=A0A6J4U8T1_9BACT|nr:MAG: Beta-phosphoglucomutase [uncultured Thermomicrobiales bacterium]
MAKTSRSVTTSTAPRAVIWDVDGTLIDSADAHILSWQEVFAREGYPAIERATFDRWFGRRTTDVLREHFGPAVEDTELLRVGNAKEAHYREALEAVGVEPLPGVEGWLDFLAESGWRLGIGSSAPIANLNLILDFSGLALHFDAVVSQEDVRRGKPDPEVFLTAASRLEVDPSRAIVVEDAAAGIIAAHRAGMRTVGVGPYHDTLGAMVSVATLVDLPEDTFDRLLSEPVPENDASSSTTTG